MPKQKQEKLSMEEPRFDEWTSCEFYGHRYEKQEDGSMRCTDCGDSYRDELAVWPNGAPVTFRDPNEEEGEDNMELEVVEDRGERVLVQWMNSGMSLQPQMVYNKSELVRI
jgi:hypothetical protein